VCHGCRILLADDNAELREALAIALRDQGFGVQTARDAYEARRLFVTFRADVVLTDIRMPGDGLMLLREIRRLSPGTPVILMTAFERPGDRTRANDAGAADFLLKPVLGDRLRAAIGDAVARSASASHAAE
jgi:DNA-binding response OmpR family regulator